MELFSMHQVSDITWPQTTIPVFDATYAPRNQISAICSPLQDAQSTCIEGLLIYNVASALRSYYSYTCILRECWPGCHSDSFEIFYKDWSGTSPNQSGPPELVGSSHRHQQGLTSLVLPPIRDRSDYSEPWGEGCHGPSRGITCSPFHLMNRRIL